MDRASGLSYHRPAGEGVRQPPVGFVIVSSSSLGGLGGSLSWICVTRGLRKLPKTSRSTTEDEDDGEEGAAITAYFGSTVPQ
jgi:hypothetical protein